FITSGRMLLLITVIGIVANGYYLYSPRGEDYAGDFSEIKDFDPEIRINPEKYPDEWSTAAVNNFWYSDASLIHDASGDKDGREFIRMSGYEPDNNASLQAGISSTQYFWSLSDANIWQFFEEMANNEVRCYHYEGLDDRAALNALAAVNYYSVFDKERIGYGFEDGDVNFGRLSWAYNVYKGSTYLDFGTFFNAYVDREDYEAMTPLQRQDVLLDGIVLDRPEEDAEGIRRVNTTYSPEELPYEIECENDDISIDNGRVTVTKPDSSLSLIFKGKENAETYLYIKGLEFEGRTQLSLYKDNDPDADPKDLYNSENWKNLSLYDRNEMLFEDRKKPSFEEADIHVRFTGDEGDSCTKNLVYMTEEYNKYMNKHDFLVNSIYSEGAFNKVRLEFSNIGSFSFDEIKLYSVDIKNVTERIKSLKGCSLQNLDLHYRDDTYSTEKISGSIDAGEKGLLLLQIPYSKGWKAFVDEKEVPVLRADTMFMALPLDKGHHDIVMKYSTPGLKTGAIISIAGLIILLVSIAVSFYSKKAAFQGRDGEEKADSRRNIQ
ncbi:MAG: YfhO family protein, partial [Lachnospiraceae bacterium]|nr:YfhO family protein [Lachnospiraceae bacterium]